MRYFLVRARSGGASGEAAGDREGGLAGALDCGRENTAGEGMGEVWA